MGKYTLPVPIEVQWIADAVGEDATFTFIEAYGGQSIWVPGLRIEQSNLARAWGLPLAECLSDRWGGTHYSVPMLKAWRVRRLALLGFSYNEICARTGVSRCRINAALRGISGAVRASRIVPDERQLSLF